MAVTAGLMYLPIVFRNLSIVSSEVPTMHVRYVHVQEYFIPSAVASQVKTRFSSFFDLVQDGVGFPLAHSCHIFFLQEDSFVAFESLESN